MTIYYPASLPCFLQSGYSLQHENTVQRSDLVSGRARQRQRCANVPTFAKADAIFTEAQAQEFERFFRWDLDDGSEWFNCTLKTPMGVREYECRFAEIYDGPNPITPAIFKISAKFEIKDRQTWSEVWADYGLQYIAMQDLIDIALNREWPT